jgi:hypothetical protein
MECNSPSVLAKALCYRKLTPERELRESAGE